MFVVWLHVGFASAHDAQAHADHDTTVVECHCSDVHGVQQSGDRAVRAKQMLAVSKFGQTRFELPLSFSSSSPASALRTLRATPGSSIFAVEVAAVTSPLASRCAFPSPERLSLCLFSLLFFLSKTQVGFPGELATRSSPRRGHPSRCGHRDPRRVGPKKGAKFGQAKFGLKS